MQLPIGYVGFTVPQELLLLTDLAGRSMPYYDPSHSEEIAALSGRLYGFEYVLAHHNEKAGARQPFPADYTVLGYRRIEGLVEESGSVEEYGWDEFEEFQLYGDQTVDLHGWYTGVTTGTGYARVQVAMRWVFAVMPRMTSWGPYHANFVVLGPAEVDLFQRSRTLEVRAFYEMNIQVQGAPTHRLTWSAFTRDPASGDQITWQSGDFYYEGNSPKKAAPGGRAGFSRNTRAVVIEKGKIRPQGTDIEIRLEARTRGPEQTFWALVLTSPRLSGEISFRGERPPDLKTTEDGVGVTVGGIELIVGKSDEVRAEGRRILLPSKRRGFKVSVPRGCTPEGLYEADPEATKILNFFYS
jgi:hypothetical protein